ncbi:MAG TPA: hypothetical protein DDW52_14095 [Planctomycetaceae bacterium]|nr:hypothetical protein [Planctomycetaceae bacterium]
MKFIAPIWGLIGVVALLGFAIYRLAPRAWEALQEGLTPFQWCLMVVWTVFMVYSEGYRGFQKKFSPRTAARVNYLSKSPSATQTLLAPLFCMGYFGATRRVQITSICLTLGIVLLVLLVSQLPQPWRGIVDFGVVAGLSWGLLTFVAFYIQAATSENFAHDPCIE